MFIPLVEKPSSILLDSMIVGMYRTGQNCLHPTILPIFSRGIEYHTGIMPDSSNSLNCVCWDSGEEVMVKPVRTITEELIVPRSILGSLGVAFRQHTSDDPPKSLEMLPYRLEFLDEVRHQSGEVLRFDSLDIESKAA